MMNGATAVMLSLFLAGLSGCWGGGNDRPQLGLVKGVVTLDGQPLGGVAVTFQPTNGRPAMATTALDGSYELTYKPDTPGCKVGPNKVVIASDSESLESATSEGDDLVQDTSANRKERVPAKYNRNTELVADVKPGPNTFDFKLTTK